MIRLTPLFRRLLTTAAPCATQASGAAMSSEAAAATHDRAGLLSLLDRVLLRPGAGNALLAAYPVLNDRLTHTQAESSVRALRSVGASPHQLAAMLRANPLYLLELDASKFGACVAKGRAAPGTVVRRVAGWREGAPELQVRHCALAPHGSKAEEVQGNAGLPALFIDTRAALQEAFVYADGDAAAAAPSPAQQQQQFRCWVDAWLALGSPKRE